LSHLWRPILSFSRERGKEGKEEFRGKRVPKEGGKGKELCAATAAKKASAALLLSQKEKKQGDSAGRKRGKREGGEVVFTASKEGVD